MTCKTRQSALRGERSKPHYYLANNARIFSDVGKPPKKTKGTVWWKYIDMIMDFESRIDWSTWGASR